MKSKSYITRTPGLYVHNLVFIIFIVLRINDILQFVSFSFCICHVTLNLWIQSSCE